MLECHAQRAGSSGHLHIYELSYSSSDADQFLGPTADYEHQLYRAEGHMLMFLVPSKLNVSE